MSKNYARIAARLYNQPLLLAPATAEVLSEVLGARLGVAPTFNVDLTEVRQKVFAFDDEEGMGEGSDAPPYAMVDGVAIVPVMGELINRGSWLSTYSGLTSYMGLRETLTQASVDPNVTGIMLDIDSGGGEASGALETGAFVRQIAGIKPVTAFVDGMAASAAYAIASGADKIVTTPSSALGSIGVVTLHIDRTAQMDKAGLKPTLITSGKHKADYSSAQQLTDDAKSRIQATNDVIHGLFANLVAEHRGITTEAVFATEAGIFLGQASVEAGLADEVGTMETALSTLPKTKSPAFTYEGQPLMSNPSQTPADTISRADHEAALAAASASGAARAATDGATAERARVSAIMGHAEATDRKALAEHIAFRTGMSAEDGIAMLAAAPKAIAPAPAAAEPAHAGAGRIHEEMRAAGAPSFSASAPPANDPYAGMSTEQRDFAMGEADARRLLGKPKCA